MAKYVAPKTDPWLCRISKGMFNVPSATLTTTGRQHNLIAHPECRLGDEVTDSGEYARLFELAEGYFALFTDYREKTAKIGRTIPVFRLSPR